MLATQHMVHQRWWCCTSSRNQEGGEGGLPHSTAMIVSSLYRMFLCVDCLLICSGASGTDREREREAEKGRERQRKAERERST